MHGEKTIVTGGLLCLFLVACALTTTAPAQEPTDLQAELRIPDSGYVQIISTADGSTLVGRIIEIGENEIRFESELGAVSIPIESITELKLVPTPAIKKGKYWFPNPNATRLYFAPTGRMLKQSQGYFSDYYLFFPGVAFGVTDNVTIGGGMSIFPGVDIEDQLFYFTPKIGVTATKDLNFAVGALMVNIPGWDGDDSEIVGILYGVGTAGTSDVSVTVGSGYGFQGNDFADKPMVMIGAESRVSRRLAFVTENWVIPGVDEPLISYGVRFFGEALSVDLALVNILGEDAIFPGIPYVDFVYNF